MWEIIQGVVNHFNFTTKHKRIVQGSNKNKNKKKPGTYRSITITNIYDPANTHTKPYIYNVLKDL